MLKLYVDSADRAEVTRLLASGLFEGVTTNPAILDKAGLTSRDIPDVVAWATDAGARRVFVQSWGREPEEIVERGESFRTLGDNVVVKVTASREGIYASRKLAVNGPVLVTAVYSAVQILPIITSGAAFAAPFIGRMDAAGRDGLATAIAMQRATDNVGSSTRVLAGSLRTPEQMLQLATAGVTHMTFAPEVWDQFFVDELTASSVSQFEALSRL